MSKESRYDEIGPWSEVKLDIIREYAAAYSLILSKKGFSHAYIDAFAGAGLHVSKEKGSFVAGSPLNALLVDPPFDDYHFIDLNREKIQSLQDLAEERANVRIYEGDCNDILLGQVFPNVQYSQYRRALCLLDPYGLHLRWDVIETAGRMKAIEVFLNFPTMDMNMNVLWHDPGKVSEAQAARMTAFWGDDTWRAAAYTTHRNLFGYEEKESNQAVAEAFRKRLREIAGFGYVPEPIPMRNSTGATVYYLYFASQQPVANNIVNDIFDKYRNRGKS